jgi:hypothetical protein
VRRFRGNAPDAERVTQFVYLMLAGVLTGNEFSGWIGFHPALDRLPPAHRLPAEQAIYRRYGRIMPTLMTATLAAAGSILARTGRRSPAYRSTLASAACYAAMLVVTLTRNVPINQQLLALPDIPESYPEFARLRSRWDALHTARNVLNLMGLAFAIAGALASEMIIVSRVVGRPHGRPGHGA